MVAEFFVFHQPLAGTHRGEKVRLVVDNVTVIIHYLLTTDNK